MELWLLAGIAFMTALCPGADILFVLKNTLQGGGKQGIISFLGIASGWLVFFALIYFGLSSFLDNLLIHTILSFAGGFYLTYLAFKLLKPQKTSLTQSPQRVKLLYFQALFVNLSNPKAILFFTFLITPFIQHNLIMSFIVLSASLSAAFLLVIVLACFIKQKCYFLLEKIDKICAILFFFFAFLLLKEGIANLIVLLDS